jgi:hypothetical protein
VRGFDAYFDAPAWLRDYSYELFSIIVFDRWFSAHIEGSSGNPSGRGTEIETAKNETLQGAM